MSGATAPLLEARAISKRYGNVTALTAVDLEVRPGEIVGLVGVLLVSHNIPQVHQLCDRIVVLLRGRVVAEIHRRDATVEDIVMWITGAALVRH